MFDDGVNFQTSPNASNKPTPPTKYTSLFRIATLTFALRSDDETKKQHNHTQGQRDTMSGDGATDAALHGTYELPRLHTQMVMVNMV